MSELTYNRKPIALSNEGYLVLPFGEFHINDIKRECNDLKEMIEKYPNYKHDFEYLRELEAIIEKYNEMKL